MNRRAPVSPGFSLIEVIVAMAMIGLIASLSIAVVSQITSAAKEEKLASDAETLNRAIAAYVASGGSLDKVKTPNGILARLRSAATADQVDRLPGFTSSLIDLRTAFRMQTARESASKGSRILWITASKKRLGRSRGGHGRRPIAAATQVRNDATRARIAAGNSRSCRPGGA